MPDQQQRFIRILYLVIYGQFVVIAILLGGLSNEYFSNTYMRAWISANTPILGFLLHGEVDALLVGLAVGASFLLIQARIREAKPGREQSIPSNNPIPNHTPPSQSPSVQAGPPTDPSVAPSKRRSSKKPADTAPVQLDTDDSEKTG